MTTIGYLLVLISVFIIRIGYKGRMSHAGEDISDAFLAIIQGDTDALGEVLARTGDDLSANSADLSKYDEVEKGAAFGGGLVQGTLSGAAIKRGKGAKGYRWTATGPDYYDCSGLMWRACQDIKAYSGPRFTTSTVGSLSAFTRVTDPKVDDMVVWPTHHMGVVTGPDQYYSARSVKSGIGYSKISGYGKGKPIYLRVKSDGK